MNKYGFLSGILTLILFLFQFIPLGLIVLEPGGTISIWIIYLFNISKNPILNYKTSIPVSLFYFPDKRIYLWGIVSEGNMYLWYAVHILSFIPLFILSLCTIVISFIGSLKESKKGRTLLNYHFGLLLIIVSYSIIGISLFSQEILGFNLQLLNIIFHLDFGFYILLLAFVLALVARSNHPIK